MPVNIHNLKIPRMASRIELSADGLTRSDHISESRELSENTWIAKNSLGYNILSNEDVSVILKDSRWHSAIGLLADLNPYTTPEFKTRRKTSMLAVDGEAHRRLKKLVSPYFSPALAERMRPQMRQIMNELIEPFIEGCEFDISSEVFSKYPTKMICNILGIPDVQLENFTRWSEDILSNWGSDFSKSTERILKSQQEMDEYIGIVISERRIKPQTDLISMLLSSRDGEDFLSDEEVTTLVETLVIAGMDTIHHQLGSILLAMLENKELWHHFRGNAEDRPRMIEELLRINGSVCETGRIASEDIEHKGILFPKGTIVFINLSSSNMDTKVFQDPDSINLLNEKQHFAFGGGLHKCIGAALARAEIQIALDVIAEKMPAIKKSGDVLYSSENSAVYGPVSLRVKI
jgi:cytochrome P450